VGKDKYMPMMTTALYAAFGIGAVSGIVFGLTWVAFRLWCHPKRILSSVSPADSALAFETIQFSSQGIRLEGWFIPALLNEPRAPAVILMHGWNHHAGRMLDLAKAIHPEGYAILLFNGRGHGRSGSDGPSYVLKFAQDIVAAVDYLEGRPEVDAKRIGVIGHSMGGSGAILAAAMDRRIQAVVSSSAFCDPTELTRNTLRKMHLPIWPFLTIMQWIFRRWIGMPIEAVAPRRRIGEIAVPVLLAHGACDDHVQPVHLDLLFEHADPANVQRLVLDGCKHSDMLKAPFYFEKVRHFLYNALKTEPGRLSMSRQDHPGEDRH